MMKQLGLILSVLAQMVLFSELAVAKSHHQIGEVWGKERIPTSPQGLLKNSFIKGNPFAHRVAEATAWLTHPAHNNKILNLNYLGSAHFLGVFGGKFVMMTNSHLVHEKFCNGITIEFVYLPDKPQVTCSKVFYRNERLDLALMFVNPEEKDKDLLKDKGINLAYDKRPRFAHPLYSIGFSRHNGIRGLKPGEAPRSPAVGYLTRDNDCRVLSYTSKLIRNPKPDTEMFKPAHSFAVATGCDAFDAGDCGAVYVEEGSENIVGLYWSEGLDPADVIDGGQTYVYDDNLGRIPNSEPGSATVDKVPASVVQSALDRTISKKHLWSKFTYMIPAFNIKQQILRDPLVHEADYACMFQQMLGERIRECRSLK